MKVKYRKPNKFVSFSLIIFSLHNNSNAEALLERKTSSQGFGKPDEFFISDSNCDQVKKHLSVLAMWTKKINKASTCDLTSIKTTTAKGKCEANVSSCLPEHVLKYQGVNPANSGPNCWNLSLVMKNILPGLRYSTPDEMAYYMRPPICRALKDNEKREVGDVGAIRGVFEGMKEESHGFIYLSDELSYSKNGFNKMSPYEVQSTDKVLSIYGVPNDPKCRKNELDTHSACGSAVSYFRCQSFDDFLAKAPDIKPETLKAVKNVMHFEQCLQKATIDGAILSKEAASSIENSVLSLIKFLNENKKKSKNRNEQENFILGSLYLRLSAIGEQLDIIERPEDGSMQFMAGPNGNSKKVFELAEMLKESHDEITNLVEGINQ